jgi:hypothetical protein
VTYPGFTPVGNATLVVANVLTCNKHSHILIIIIIIIIRKGPPILAKQ